MNNGIGFNLFYSWLLYWTCQGQEVRTGSCRKTPEINGTWKQYSGQKFFGFFRWLPTIFERFPVESTRFRRPKSSTWAIKTEWSQYFVLFYFLVVSVSCFKVNVNNESSSLLYISQKHVSMKGRYVVFWGTRQAYLHTVFPE